jgi:hypothetical protein
MATAFTTLLGYALPTTGELDGIWGDEVNNSITQLVEDSVAGYASHDMTAADWTLTTTGSGLSNEARMMVLITSGTPGVSRNIIAPAHSKMYVVVNKSNASVAVKGASTTGATVGAGYTAVVVWNGSDFEEISPTLAKYAIDLIGGVQGSIPYQTAVNTTGLLAPGTSGQVLTSGGSGASPAWTTPISLSADNTWTGTQSFTGSTSKLAEVLTNAGEVCTISATAATGTINFDVTTQSVLYYTSNASANWTVNFRGSSGTSLNTLMTTGQSVTVAFMVTQGSTAYYNSAVTIDGSSVTPKYQNGVVFAAGNAAYVYTIIKTGSATFTVLASKTQFK